MAEETFILEDYVRFTVKDNGLLAVATFKAPPITLDRIFTLIELKDLLDKQQYSYGVLDDIELSLLLESWLGPMADVVVAQGEPPGTPTDEQLHFCFDIDPVPIPQLLDNDHVDYRELGMLQNALVGQELVYRIEGQYGLPGVDVYGNEVQSKAPQVKVLPSGSGTCISSDGMILLSEIDGQIVYGRNQRVSVLPVFHVQEDVDFSVGNIDFLGSVVVHGSVREGFTIKATGNIEVFGIVERAHLFADGDIIIRGGVQGSTKSKIYAKGSLRALYLQNAIIESEGDLIVADSVMHSIVRARSARITGKRGLLVGGLTRVDDSVLARVVGSHLGTATRIEFMTGIEEEEQLAMIMDQIVSHEETLQKTVEATRKLEELKERLGRLSSEQLTICRRLAITETTTQEKIVTLQNQRDDLKEVIDQKKPTTIEVTTMMYPGVHLIREHLEWHCDDFITGCFFTCSTDGWHRTKGRTERKT
ncbi:DUF342 domain-containing protein [Sulfoacidibacillus ferrooxidans]|uniref:Flagellar Assembly Protein A N-terminal region domain-containing protein n=1 Tax=Sulfoacidibacillus ferrooxidans TaxID=2005001 RepID=A0A9X2AF20_9BACL|nr:FapA family protein [Sulfoacidibacillus ferrooxidans]MCI0183611.1 hypothetical protein [Sulfoacidibacillus ferrooxidans]